MLAPGNPKRRFGSRGFWIATAVVLAFPVFFAVSFVADQGSHPSLRKIEKCASVQFRESARLLNSYNRSFLGIHILAKVEMDRADVPKFVKSLPQPTRMLVEYDAQRMLYSQFDWYDLRSAKHLKAVESTKDDRKGTVQTWRVFVSLGDPHKAVVYLDYASFTG